MHDEILSASFWFHLRDIRFCSICKNAKNALMNDTGSFIKCAL